jgi:hypothetical protein
MTRKLRNVMVEWPVVAKHSYQVLLKCVSLVSYWVQTCGHQIPIYEFFHKIRVGVTIMSAACSMLEDEDRDVQGFSDKT